VNYAIQFNDLVISSPPAVFEGNIWRSFTTLGEDPMIDDIDISDTRYSPLTYPLLFEIESWSMLVVLHLPSLPVQSHILTFSHFDGRPMKVSPASKTKTAQYEPRIIHIHPGDRLRGWEWQENADIYRIDDPKDINWEAPSAEVKRTPSHVMRVIAQPSKGEECDRNQVRNVKSKCR